MTVIAGRRALAIAQRGFKNDITREFQTVADQISAILFRNSDFSGSIPTRNEKAVLQDAGAALQRMFVGLDGRSPFADDGITPLAAYPRILNKWLIYVTAQVVYGHRDWMKRTLPEDVFNWLASHGRVGEIENPYLRKEGETNEEFLARLGALETLFRPNPLAKYEAPHTWVDPNGYRLSDRIWRASVRTRMQLDALLTESIRAGMGSLELSRLVARFLLPSRADLRTKKPYGRSASADGMRLARTEITAAHGRATLAAARANPYVSSITWRLSASHPRSDICDPLAEGSPYELDKVPSYPPHPNCICALVPNVTESAATITAVFRDIMAAGGEPPSVTPAHSNNFLFLLLGMLAFSNEFVV